METGADVEYEGAITAVDLEASRGKKQSWQSIHYFLVIKSTLSISDLYLCHV